jgi:diaminopimelate epimerase
MKREFRFTKFHGCGNDFLIVDETRGKRTSDRARSKLARKLTDRHFQVGADGLMFLEPARGFDCSMRLFEPAGNEADMCGNGIRCIAAYLMERLEKHEVDILTRDGLKHISRVGGEYSVEMGEIRTTRADLRSYITDKGKTTDSMLAMTIKADGRDYKGSIVNSGEPHIVVRAKDLEALDMVAIGDSVNEDRRRFPKGVNVNFVEVAGPHSIRVRTYERGVYDETLACGTGATASAAVALLLGWVRPGKVSVLTRGGRLRIDVDKDGKARMTGPATRVYEGRVVAEV